MSNGTETSKSTRVNFQVAIQCQVPAEGQVVPVMCQSLSESEVFSITGGFPSAI